jgi:hypothetical protein
VIIHGFFTPVHAAATFGQTMGFTAFGTPAVALLSFPMAPAPGERTTFPATIGLSSPATAANTKNQTTPSALDLTQ